MDGLCKIINECGLWVVTSGEQDDPMSMSVAEALRCVLPHRESKEETLVIAVNSADIAYKSDTPTAISQHARIYMADSRFNTMFLIWNKEGVEPERLLAFRACAAVKLAMPPPGIHYCRLWKVEYGWY